MTSDVFEAIADPDHDAMIELLLEFHPNLMPLSDDDLNALASTIFRFTQETLKDALREPLAAQRAWLAEIEGR